MLDTVGSSGVVVVVSLAAIVSMVTTLMYCIIGHMCDKCFRKNNEEAKPLHSKSPGTSKYHDKGSELKEMESPATRHYTSHLDSAPHSDTRHQKNSHRPTNTSTTNQGATPQLGFVSLRGELLLSLTYNPTHSKLLVEVAKARHLPALDINNFSDPFVKVWSVHKGKKIEKHKTKIVKKSLNPSFNESFSFTISSNSFSEYSLLLSVIDEDVMKENDIVGHIMMGKDGGSKEGSAWARLLEHPGHALRQWYTIEKDLPPGMEL